jgi:hypothetical protein
MPFANDVVANFTTGDQLFAYACTDRQADWLPWCPFPYINAGWGTDNITLGDCSMLYSETQPYLTKRIVYSVLNLVLLLVSLQHVKVCVDRKRDRKKGGFNPKELGCLYTCAALVVNAIRILDMTCWAGMYDYAASKLFNGFIISFMMMVVLGIVKAWVTVVDGGKAKVTPAWILNLEKGMMGLLVFCEVPMAVMEVVLAPLPEGQE